jgi:hypothetical protein
MQRNCRQKISRVQFLKFFFRPVIIKVGKFDLEVDPSSGGSGGEETVVVVVYN